MHKEIKTVELRNLQLEDYKQLKNSMIEAYPGMENSYWKEDQIDVPASLAFGLNQLGQHREQERDLERAPVSPTSRHVRCRVRSLDPKDTITTLLSLAQLESGSDLLEQHRLVCPAKRSRSSIIHCHEAPA